MVVVAIGNRPGLWRVYLALIVASLLWGSLYSAAKLPVVAVGAIQVTLCRVVLAFACLGFWLVLLGLAARRRSE